MPVQLKQSPLQPESYAQMYQESFRVVTSYVCMTRVPYALIDIYVLWKRNGINKSSNFVQYRRHICFQRCAVNHSFLSDIYLQFLEQN